MGVVSPAKLVAGLDEFVLSVASWFEFLSG